MSQVMQALEGAGAHANIIGVTQLGIIISFLTTSSLSELI